ncbi:MAG: carboxypeptidase regulatory-like domain-containing protein [Acidobacteriota bacterium]|nr:carboxypeptidase regulatory-like domain-containing protein [Acidobacteriota bacterium]
MSLRNSLQAVKASIPAALVLAFAWAMTIEPVRAQVLYGSVVGTVSDPSGSVIPGATLTLTSQDTGLARESTSDEGGRYSFVNVLPGRYNLKAVTSGFRTLTEENIEISANTVRRADFKLEVGQTTDQVTVEATSVALQTEKSDTHGEIQAKTITSLPLGGYRNYQTLINLVPGTTPAALQNSITDTPGRALQTHINGGSAQTNITRIDGAESVNVWLPHHVGYVTPSENIEAVNVTTSAADAEQGMAGAGAITLITKGGTNNLHGSAFWFHDDQHLKARNDFQAYGTDKPLSIFNNFGATFGGPIKKNKIFYFVSYEGTRQRQASPGLFTVPTGSQLNGDFSGLTTIIYDPQTGNADGTGRTPFPNNKIPANRLDPIALKLQSYYPAANNGLGLVNNYFAAGGPILNRNNLDAKGDYVQSAKQSLFLKYGRLWATAGGKAVFGLAGGPGLSADPGVGDTLIQVATIGQTRTISPHLIIDGVVGYERQGQSVIPNDYGKNYGQQFGIPNTNGPDIRQSGFPDISISGYAGFGVPNWMPAFRVEESFTHSDNVTYTKGAHEFRFGFDLVRHHLNHWQPEIGNFGPRGGLGFGGGETALKGGAAPNQFNAYAAFLLGLSDDAEKSLQNILSTGREWQLGWYARDRWQVSRNLTVNIGLRYEFYPLMTRAGKGIERYDPNTNNVYLGGRGNVPDDAGITVSHKLFAPRVGVAYRLGDKTVIRSGYGINVDPLPFSRPLRGWYPLVINGANTASNGYTWATTFAQGVPNVVGPDLSTGVVQLPGNVSERSPWGGEVHRGYVQTWNFTLERRLPLDLFTTVAYVGSHSVHLLADRDINAGSPGSGTTGLPQYAQFGRTVPTNMWDGYLSSEYNSLQVSVNRSLAKGVLVKAAYTYSKAMDYTDDDGWASVGWNWAPVFQRNRAAAGFDRTQVLQVGWIYELPFGKGKRMAQSGVAAAVLGNWQVNGILSAYTGTPFTVTAPGASLNAPNNTQTANQVNPTVQKLGNYGPGQFFYDPTAFAPVTAANTFGTSGRNILRNPGSFNTDLDLTRDFRFGERLDLQFRAEAFNVANTPHYNGVNSGNVTSGSFMQITSAYGERQLRFGLRAVW